MIGSELIPVTFDKIMQTRSYTVVVMGTTEKRFAIYTDPSIGRTIQMFLTGAEKPRPLTHDLLQMIFSGLQIKVKQVVINDIQDTIYFARLFLELDGGEVTRILEVDARPSDCITIALMSDIPVFCTREVLDKTVPIEE
jgi:bifunctional DNase/RNase